MRSILPKIVFVIVNNIIKIIQQKYYRIHAIKKDGHSNKYVIVYYSKSYQLNAKSAIELFQNTDLLKSFNPRDVAKIAFFAAKTHHTKCHHVQQA